ncbi:MAG: cupin domain-containing protein [Firmicutes bacterium]|nr:cupin domain-containing protein [Bacillota bacterium]MCL1953344.1 cupin domain-containing protein [Bacillota bacterium]
MQNNIITDFGPHPFIVDINRATIGNDTYRTAVWTGEYLQVTVMSIPVGDELGLEIHPDTDQFIRLEQGSGVAMMGNASNNLYIQQMVFEDDSVFVPAGTYHNIVNTGSTPIKLHTIYAPPHHPWGTIEMTKTVMQQNNNAQ